MEDMPHRYLWPCESREGGQETAVLTGEWLPKLLRSDEHGSMHRNIREYTRLYGNTLKVYGNNRENVSIKYTESFNDSVRRNTVSYTKTVSSTLLISVLIYT